MFEAPLVRISIRKALTLILIFFLSGNHSALNSMEPSSAKHEFYDKNTADDNISINYPKNQTSTCPTNQECKSLGTQCIHCNYTMNCIYGKDITITCEANKDITCSGKRSFERTMNCRFCYQSELWQYSCIYKGNCNSINEYYKTNCTVHENVFCLGNRTFNKKIKCNWTHGYKWSTALIISLTLGGFGADRFYLGHWQEGIGKLFSFGGLGVWTIIDVLLISLHYLGPADGSLYI